MSKKLAQEYEKDFYAWTLHNAELLRKGKLSEIDIAHLAEEIESMGKGERRELVNRLALLMAHLLKWKYQPIRRSKSWKLTIKEQRIQIGRLLEESPSLKNALGAKIKDAYEQATVIAERETALEENTFPKKCPFTLNECLNQKFFPE
ncbi:MAG: hypothetical protein A3F11_00820 [Gammaproteobacteria bacterium RIFCSPHIGHO2_12_FULL_37_14]|nr:MAG: hypothetical protein A3F11_00820 [Gammaproteobacteria bacterium RIFCSPHIGHO2_12_FULL_37_14]